MKFNCGDRFKLYTNLGVSEGMISTIEEHSDRIEFSGYLDNQEGEFCILDLKDGRLAGSISWNKQITLKNSFNASFITKMEKL